MSTQIHGFKHPVNSQLPAPSLQRKYTVHTNMPSGRRSSGRLRKLSSRVRDVDGNTIASAQAAQLARLEEDVAPSEESASDFENEEEEEVVIPVRAPSRSKRRRASGRGEARGKRARLKGVARHNKPLQSVLDAERGGTDLPRGMVFFEDIAAAPSVKPRRKLCSVCGYKAPYTCSRCVVYFCSVRCSRVHEDTRCLKFTM